MHTLIVMNSSKGRTGGGGRVHPKGQDRGRWVGSSKGAGQGEVGGFIQRGRTGGGGWVHPKGQDRGRWAGSSTGQDRGRWAGSSKGAGQGEVDGFIQRAGQGDVDRFIQEFITIRLCNCHMVSTTTISAV